MPAWEPTLPQDFLLDSYRHQMANNRIQSQMDQGAPKVRRKQTKSFEPVSGAMAMTKAQVTTLRTFYKTTLEEGALTFDMDDPISGTSSVWRFAEPPSWTPMQPDLFRVELSMVIIE